MAACPSAALARNGWREVSVSSGAITPLLSRSLSSSSVSDANCKGSDIFFW